MSELLDSTPSRARRATSASRGSAAERPGRSWRGRTIGNLLAYQAGWWACVLGAGAGDGRIGPAVTAVAVLGHLAITRDRAGEGALVLGAALLGYLMDSGLILLGLVEFPASAALGGPSPLWMVALWAGFATTLNDSLGWLRGRFGLGLLLGACAGPAAYRAGLAFGAIDFPAGQEAALAAIAVEWAVAMPALQAMALWSRDAR